MFVPVLLAFLVLEVHGECTRKIILIPLFYAKTQCGTPDCGAYVENFVYICTYNSQDTSYTDFSIEDNLAKQLKSDSNDCIDESMAVILTDIPCSEYSKYPDLQQMFGDQFAKTIKRFNTEFSLHTVILFLSGDLNDTKNEPCPSLANYTFNPQQDFMQFRHITYEDIFNNYQNICDWTFLATRNRTGTSSPMNQALTTGLIIGCSIVGLLVIGLTAFCGYKVRRRYLQSKLDMFAEEHASRARRLLFGEPKLSVDQWELTPKELKVEATVVLGTGVSATVYKGRVKKKRDNYTIEMDVAVKFAHSYADQSRDMIREIQFMKTIGQHDNLLVMIGCVKDPENPTSERCNEVDVCLLLTDLLRIASQVCAGMVHLSSLGFVHRDLAARNVFLTDDLTAKIGDFGLCRLTADALYTQKGGKLPVKHMSYEALKFGEFSEKSDVWSYGILLFEIFSGGQRPFADIETDQLISHLEDNGKAEFPAECPEQLVRIAHTKCFQKMPNDRATFREIQDEIDRLLDIFDI
ncbi:Protein kinase domain-containing protein [Aphelenchoides besseyi]|nr:Protein kinase domain-containing protein [Aphelenchoides besseyi]